jgi:6-phosphogluconolactonase (cycloisomerase 2 family)
VGSEGTPDIWVFTVNSSTGVLTATAGSPFTAGLSVAADVLTVDASGKFLYAGQTDPLAGVAGYSIDQTTGALTALTGSPFLLGVAQLQASPKAELLLGTAEIQDGTTAATDLHLYVYSIDFVTGIPTAVAGSPFTTAAAPFDFVISPNGLFVYALEATVATKTVAPIEGFALNSGTGALTSIGSFTGVATAEGCRFDQSGNILFCIDTIVGGTTMSALSANPGTGVLTHVANLTASPNFPFAVTD